MLLAALILFATVIYVLFGFRKDQSLPPSPPFTLPIVGHLHLLGKAPHESLQQLTSKYGSNGFLFLKLGYINTLIVGSPHAASQVLKTHDAIFASRPIATGGIIFGYNSISLTYTPYNEHFKQLRKFCNLELFVQTRFNMFFPVRRQEMTKLLVEISRSTAPFHVLDRVMGLTFDVVLRMLLSKNTSEAGDIRRIKNFILDIFVIATDMGIGDFVPYLKWMDTGRSKSQAIIDELDPLVQKEVDEHRKLLNAGGATKDFIDIMLSKGFDDTLIKSEVLDILGAGTESIAVTVEWGLAQLLKNGLVGKVQAELDSVIGKNRIMEESDIPKLKFLDTVVKETFRLHPSVPIFNHETTEACKVDNFIIPKGTRVMVNAYAIGRDPSAWESPDTFNPSRFQDSQMDVRGQHFELLPFGSGRRSCPAIQMGLLMVQFTLGSLLHTFDWELADGSNPRELNMTAKFGATLPIGSSLKLIPSFRLDCPI